MLELMVSTTALTLRKDGTLRSHLRFYSLDKELWISHKGNKALSISHQLLGICSEIWLRHYLKNSISKIFPQSRHQETLIGLKPEGKPPEDRQLQHYSSKPVAFRSGLSHIHITLLHTKGLRHRNRSCKSQRSLHVISTSKEGNCGMEKSDKYIIQK